MSGIYILTKRILLQFWAHFTLAGYTNYLVKKHRKTKKTKKIRLSNEEDLYLNNDGYPAFDFVDWYEDMNGLSYAYIDGQNAVIGNKFENQELLEASE